MFVAFWRGRYWCDARLVVGLNELRPYGPNVVVPGACRSTAQLAHAAPSQIYARGQSADRDRPALFSVRGRFWREAVIRESTGAGRLPIVKNTH